MMADAKKKKTPFAFKMLIVMMIVLAGIFLPTTIVMAVCLLPSFVAAMIDRQPQKTAWLTVGAMNLAGAMPAWLMLWEKGHKIMDAVQVITAPVPLIIAYGGAAAGWMVYHNVTPFVASIVVGKNERRLKDIEKRQKELIRKWGEDVVHRG
jgi:hypothetical protein